MIDKVEIVRKKNLCNREYTSHIRNIKVHGIHFLTHIADNKFSENSFVVVVAFFTVLQIAIIVGIFNFFAYFFVVNVSLLLL